MKTTDVYTCRDDGSFEVQEQPFSVPLDTLSFGAVRVDLRFVCACVCADMLNFYR